MKEKIFITLDDNHYLNCEDLTIARKDENDVKEFEINILSNWRDSWVYIDFEKADGTTVKTPKLNVVNGIANYVIPNSLIDIEGTLKTQIVLQKETGEVWKSDTKTFFVENSINATDDIPEKEKEDFITEAQKLLEEIKQNGGGTSVSEEIQVSSTMPTSKSVMLWYEIEGNATVDLNNFFLENNKNDLIINYQDDLGLNFEVVNNELIITNDVINLDFTINEEKEMEVSYE